MESAPARGLVRFTGVLEKRTRFGSTWHDRWVEVGVDSEGSYFAYWRSEEEARSGAPPKHKAR